MNSILYSNYRSIVTFLFPTYYISKKTAMNQTHKTIIDQFSKLEKIGSGLTSTVYKGTHKQLGQVCLKVIDQKFYSKPIGKLLIDNEIELLKSFNHKNLLKLKKSQKNDKENVIITEFCEGGNLYELTKKCKKFTEKQTLIIVEAIVSGLAYLYDKNIIHRDLKPENIFFRKGQPIVADFGFAVHLENKQLYKVNAGSPLYMAPEAMKDLDFSVDSEVFSIGVIVYEMLTGKTPWIADSEKQLRQNMLSTKPVLDLVNKKFESLLKKCLQPAKQKRAKFSQIVSFFNDWKEQYFKQSQIFKDLVNVTKGKQTSKSISKQTTGSKDEKKPKKTSKDKTKTKIFKLNIKPIPDKQNVHNRTLSSIKTNRIESSKSTYQNRSIILQADGAKTKRLKIDKSDMKNSPSDLVTALRRLDPDQMRFLPASMIEKFKFILMCYVKMMDSKDLIHSKDIPKGLMHDQMSMEVSKCKNEKELCRSIQSYIGRMYRLAKNYKIYDQFIRDIEVLTRRVESFCS